MCLLLYQFICIHPPIISRRHILNYNPHVNCTSYRCLFLSESKNPVQTGTCPNRNKSLSPRHSCMDRFNCSSSTHSFQIRGTAQSSWGDFLLCAFFQRCKLSQTSTIIMIICLAGNLMISCLAQDLLRTSVI